MENVVEWKAVRWPKRKHYCVFCGRCLQLEVKLATKPLSQCQSPRPIQTATKRRVQHELHAATVIEESLEHEIVLRRQHTEHNLRPREILNNLLRGGLRNPHFFRQPLHSTFKPNPGSIVVSVNPHCNFLS